MLKFLKKLIVYFFGVVFLLLGLLGLVLPVLQGFLFIAIGVFLLTFYLPNSREWFKERARPYPKLLSFLNRVERWLQAD